MDFQRHLSWVVFMFSALRCGGECSCCRAFFAIITCIYNTMTGKKRIEIIILLLAFSYNSNPMFTLIKYGTFRLFRSSHESTEGIEYITCDKFSLIMQCFIKKRSLIVQICICFPNIGSCNTHIWNSWDDNIPINRGFACRTTATLTYQYSNL